MVEKNYLSNKDASQGTWPIVAQAAWESYAYHVLGQSQHFMLPNSEQELIRLGIAVPKKPIAEMIETPEPISVRVPSTSNTPKKIENVATEPKTLSRVINHAADSI